MLGATARECLETIYNVSMEGDAVVGARLAEKFGISPATMAEMLQRLARDGCLTMDRATGAVLTEQGAVEAEASLRRHRLAQRFLLEVLGMDWITVHEEVHALEPALTPAIGAHMVAVLGNPTTWPHGNPIPGSASQVRDFLRGQHALRLSAAPVGVPLCVLCISEVVEDETALLRYVGDVGLCPARGPRWSWCSLLPGTVRHHDATRRVDPGAARPAGSNGQTPGEAVTKPVPGPVTGGAGW
jgi:DtxR family transcriptional regulator, Mn-dependent transcriptional regulator